MTKEQLIALGLTEEQADKVVSGFGIMVPKSRFDDKIQEAKDLQDQLTQRDKDLKELKKASEGNEDLKEKYDSLEEKYKNDKTEFENQLKATQRGSAIKLALAGKVHDADLVASLLDGETIELDKDGNIAKGLDDQIKTLKESKSFLFVDENSQPNIKGAKPADGDPGTPPGNKETSYGEQLAKDSAASNKGLEEARDSYFN